MLEAAVPLNPKVQKDQPTVSPEGISLGNKIHGVLLDHRPLHEDERGELLEVYNPAWGLHPDPLVYAYCVFTRPRQIRGWVVHRSQDDRLFFLHGVFRIALFDDRPDSPTYHQLDVFVISERNRRLLIIPRGVFHAIQNIGTEEAIFMNLPTRPYNHSDPDKYRLPLRNDIIPFAFEDNFVV
jgi:dTDP-4-dehydrorhamnose 3,5-epimerase